MNYIMRLILVALLTAQLGGCFTDSRAGSSISFEVLFSEIGPANGVIENRQVEFINSQYAFEEAVSRYRSETAGQIDFSVNQVLLLNIGDRPESYVEITVDSIVEDGGVLTVHATEKRAGEGCIIVAAFTSPYVFVRVPSTARVQTVVLNEEVTSCDVS